MENEWGTGNSGGHRAAFCIPILVSRELAYNIFERQTCHGQQMKLSQFFVWCCVPICGSTGVTAVYAARPDLARKSVRDAETGEERRIRLGEDYKGRPVDSNRDVWVVQVMNGAGEVQHAGAEADGLLRLLRTRLANLREELGDDAEPTLDCMHELGSRLLGRAYYDEAEILYKECLDRRQGLSACIYTIARISVTYPSIKSPGYWHRCGKLPGAGILQTSLQQRPQRLLVVGRRIEHVSPKSVYCEVRS